MAHNQQKRSVSAVCSRRRGHRRADRHNSLNSYWSDGQRTEKRSLSLDGKRWAGVYQQAVCS